MGKFKGSLYTEFLPPRFWRLTEALKLNTDSLNDVDKQMLNEIPGIKCTKAGMITVPEGYITDLASVPRICWIFIAPFDVARAAICHDIMYEKLNAVRKKVKAKEFKAMRAIADTVFMNGMNASEPPVRAWKKFAAYWAVRMFGWSAIKSSAPRKW